MTETHEEKKKKATLEELRKTLSQQELDHIQLSREAALFTRDSPTFKIFVCVDPLRVQYKQSSQKVQKCLWNIENCFNVKTRLSTQLQTKNITEQLKDGITMNEQEVLAEIEHSNWIMQDELNSVPQALWLMRGIVGQHDIANNVIVTREDYENYISSIDERLKKYGLSLY